MLEYFSRSCFIWWPVASPEMLMFTMEEVFHLDWGSIVNFLLKTKWMNWILRAVSTSNCYKGNQCRSPRFQQQSSAPLTPKFINTSVAILTPALKMRSKSSWHQHLLVVMLLTAMLFFLVKSFLSADPNTFTRYTSDPSAGYTGVQIGVVWFGLSAALSDKDTQYGSKFVVMKILFMFLQKVSYAHQGCIY